MTKFPVFSAAEHMAIRRLRGGDEDRLREIRLRALADAPAAFAATLDRESLVPTVVWKARVTSPKAVSILAERTGAPVGTVAANLEDRPATAQMTGMWVAPECRGRGLGRLLVGAVIAWAYERQVRYLELWVTEANASARALYQATGFAATDERQPQPSNPACAGTKFVRELGCVP